jgi:hypothetical protein
VSNEKVMSVQSRKFPFKRIQPGSNIRASERVLRSMLQLSYCDIFTTRKILTAQMAVLLVMVACYALSSCGGGSSSGSSPSGSQPDFSLSAQPATVVIAPGGTQSAQVSVSGVNGFSGSVQVTTSTPSGISVSPSSFSLSIGNPQQLTFSAASSVSAGASTVTFTANEGSITHTIQLQTEIDLAVTGSHSPLRTRYLRTDAQYDPNSLQFFPPHFAKYDSVHNRFFISNYALNRVDVFDATSESEIGSVLIPAPWGIDVAPDGSKMYVATAFGDIYLVDPSALSVVQHFPSITIGPQGYAGIEPFILSTGQLALLGGVSGLNVDGATSFAIWDPTTNNLQVVSPGIFDRPAFGNIGQMSLTADRSKAIIASADSDGTLGLYDPSTGTPITGQANGIVNEILPTPDGSRLLLTYESGEFDIYNASTLAQLGTFNSTGFGGSYGAALSSDGSTLFSTDLLGDVSAYDTTSFAQKGWVPNFEVFDSQEAIVLSATDNTGLFFGPIGHGVAFLDTTRIEPGIAQTIFSLGFLAPGTGSTNGGTAVQAQVSEENASSAEDISSGTIYIGNVPANSVSLSNSAATALTPPASTMGPADFTVVLSDGSIQLNPENFSYGPTIVELSTNAASAEGGTQGVVFGYGLGQQPSDVTVTVGGQAAPVTQVLPSVSPIAPYPFPMEAVLFAIPAGTAGTTATVTLTTANGSATSTTSLNYVPAVQNFALQGASLMQGLHDPTRGVVYFTDQSQIDVFSPSTNNWLAPITISYTNGKSRLLGVALSPDGNTMAVSDAGNARIYLLNPSSPTSAKSFRVLTSNDNGNLQPWGLAVTNSGIVYFGSYNNESDPAGGFHQLNTSTGQITDYYVPSLENGDAFMRILMSPDASYVYGSGGGCPSILNTSTGSIVNAITACNIGDGNEDMAISSDGSVLLTSDLLTDPLLNIEGDVTYVDRDVWLPLAVYGQKLNSDGSLVFTPLTTGIDVHDGTTGLLVYRVELPLQIVNAYDALAIDDTDGLLFAITENGITEINLSSLPLAPFTQIQKRHEKLFFTDRDKTILPANSKQGSRKRRFNRPHLRHSPPARKDDLEDGRLKR